MGWARMFVVACATAAVAVGCGGGTEPIGSSATESSSTVETSTVVTTTATTVVDEPVQDSTTSTTTAVTTSTHAAESSCEASDTTSWLVAGGNGGPFGGYAFDGFRSDEMGLWSSEVVEGTNVIRIEWGQIGRAEEGPWLSYTSVDDPELARYHTMLQFNHLRSIAALFLFVDVRHRLETYDGFGGVADVRATWDGVTLSYADGASEPFPALGLLPPPSEDPLRMSEEERVATWDRVHEWVGDIQDVTWGGVDTLLALQDENLSLVREDLCRLLDTEWLVAHELARNTLATDLIDTPEIFFPELMVHDLLILTEYLTIIQDFMSSQRIDWLEGPEADLTVAANDGVTTAGEYLGLWQFAAGDVISRYVTLNEALGQIDS